jgi:hypothetical protein
MELARARLADETWLPFLTGQFGDAVVDSTYRHAVNIRLASGDLLWITANGATRAPNALLTDAGDFRSVLAGQPVRVTGSAGLAVGALFVDLQDCHTYSCRTEPCGPVVGQLLVGRQIAASVLDRCGVSGGLIQTEGAATHADAFSRATSTRLAAGAADMQAAVAAQDAAGAIAAAGALIGLGIGSTPSGDDYLLGCLAVLFMHDRTRRFGGEVSARVRPLCDATTPVSRSYLLAACDGRFHLDVTEAIGMIFLGKPAAIRSAVERVVAMGATSGSDTMVGILDTLNTPYFSTVPTTPSA